MNEPARIPAGWRPRFSLRMLLGAVTACCILCGLLPWIWSDDIAAILLFVVSPAVAISFVASLVSLAIYSALPSQRQLLVCGIASGTILLVLSHFEGPWPLYDLWLVMSTGVLAAALWIAELMAWIVLRSQRNPAAIAEGRNAARQCLGLIGSGIVISVLLRATAFAARSGIEALFLALWVTAAAGLMAAVPWIHVLRRRMIVERRPGAAEYVSLFALTVSCVLPLFAIGAAVVIVNMEVTGLQAAFGYKEMLLWLFSGIPFIMATVFVVVGFLIELWRDQWHRGLTTVACLWVSANWLALGCYAVYT